MNRINLLPAEIKADIEQSKRNKKVLSYLLRAIFILIIIIASTIALHLYINSKLSSYLSDIEQKELSIVKYGNLEKDAKNLSDRLVSIEEIDASSNTWSPVVAGIQEVMPSGAYLSSIKIDSDPKTRNSFSGIASSKSVVAALRDSLEDSEKFEYVDIESSNLVLDSKTAKEVENFVITFSLTKGALDE
ncbi:MAG: PilN domain-containing protein [Patescibacteria group bacterium]|nr:PilN domain-containing protein [Patescibacteria group bacterium]